MSSLRHDCTNSQTLYCRAEVLTARPGRFTTGKTQALIEYDIVCVPEPVVWNRTSDLPICSIAP